MGKKKSPHGKRYSALEKKRALALLRKKHSLALAAWSVGASEKAVRRWAIEAGIAVPNPGRRFDRDRMRQWFGREKTVAQVCAHFGCSERYARGVKSGELQ